MPLSPVIRIEASEARSGRRAAAPCCIGGIADDDRRGLSSATAASTAAISSASGGSGMYSLAPARMASTARLRRRCRRRRRPPARGCARPRWRAIRRGDVELDVDHQQVGAPAGAQRVRAPPSMSSTCATLAPRSSRSCTAAVMLAVQLSDDQKPHGVSPQIMPRGLRRCASPSLMISVMVTPSRSSTTTTSPRATSRLLT